MYSTQRFIAVLVLTLVGCGGAAGSDSLLGAPGEESQLDKADGFTVSGPNDREFAVDCEFGDKSKWKKFGIPFVSGTITTHDELSTAPSFPVTFLMTEWVHLDHPVDVYSEYLLQPFSYQLTVEDNSPIEWHVPNADLGCVIIGEIGVDLPAPPDGLEETEAGLSGALGSHTSRTFDVPEGMNILRVDLLMGYGDADLYVEFDSPTRGSQCWSNNLDRDESCTFYAPEAGTWHVAIYGHSSYSDYTLTASAE